MKTWLLTLAARALIEAERRWLGPPPGSPEPLDFSPLRSSRPESASASPSRLDSWCLPPEQSAWPDWALQPVTDGKVRQCHFCGDRWQVKWSPVDLMGDAANTYRLHMQRHADAATTRSLEREEAREIFRRNGLET